MSHKTYIGIDNGVSGTLAAVSDSVVTMVKTPVKSEQSYTKAKNNISRIRFDDIVEWLRSNSTENPSDTLVVMERPLLNPTRFKASISAMRALEATLIAVESLKLPHIYVDSRDWQKDLLPRGVKGSVELKLASNDIGCRLFPNCCEIINKHGDADSLLMAEWARRKNL